MSKVTKEQQELITNTLNGLKDFQIKSVEHLYHKLYSAGQKRVLLADEVGLGKTIVAKGIIAKAFKHYLENVDRKNNKTFNVVYICSNQALAKQNIDKLNFTGDKKNVDETVNRLIYLAYEPKKTNNDFLIQALTPNVSFKMSSTYGEVNERAIIFNLITYYQRFNKQSNKDRYNALIRILRGSSYLENWKYAIANEKNHELRNEIFGIFKKHLLEFEIDKSMPKTFAYFKSKPISLWLGLSKICDNLFGQKIEQFNFIDELVKNLRKELSKICLQYLGADIFILDEFQRFSNIIKLEESTNENEAVEIARAIFQLENSKTREVPKTLLLSATPFKPYTSGYDHINGEVHQKEFDDVLKFLMNVESTSESWLDLTHQRKQFFNYLINPNALKENTKDALITKQNLEQKYFEVMLRTERLLASEDNNALLCDVLHEKSSTKQNIAITVDDIEDFVALDKLTIELNNINNSKLPIPVEYVKSCPFALSFLQDYQHHKKLIDALKTGDKKLFSLVKETKNLWLNTKAINSYRNLLPNSKLPNAKIRLLSDEAIGKQGWKLLWIPPTVNYYKPNGVYSNTQFFSKTLVFSAWQMVPRMISTLLSYEVERLSFDKVFSKEEKEEGIYFKKNSKDRRKPLPLIVFPATENEYSKNFILKYPSTYLTNCFDPLEFASYNYSTKEILSKIEEVIKTDIVSIIEKYGNSENQQFSKRWQWALPVLLDKEKYYATTLEWINNESKISNSIIEADDEAITVDENKGEKKYRQLIKDLLNGNCDAELPKIKDEKRIDELVSFIAKLALGSACICGLRALQRLPINIENSTNAAYEIGSAFITLFNKPESIAVVQINDKEQNYIDDVLDYAINGNMQAMLDEYTYMLHDSENLKNATDIANHIGDILSVKTTSVKIDDDETIKSHSNDKPKLKTMRCHYAVGFGGTKMVASKSGKEINVRQAFNSPFRPFVLASTSIGQEGLDFHLYCKRIFHWNLPHNPIDFEQREGRINRYKSLVIRQNLFDKYHQEVLDTKPKEYWHQLFKTAEKEKQTNKSKSDLVPYWHTETNSNIKIERFVPLLPFSRDIEKYKNLLKVLTYYRLTFGQARQDELIDALDNDIDKELLNGLLINLSSLNLR